MKRVVTLFLLSLLVICGFTSNGRAANLLGGQIEFADVAPNVFVVSFIGYYDCSGAAYPATLQLNVTAPGCHAGQNITLNAIPTGVVNYESYCPAVGNTCNSNSLPNIRVVPYRTTIALPLTTAPCPEWVFSYRDCSRQPVANIQNSANACLYIESKLKSTFLVGETPQIIPPASFFVNLNEPATIHLFGWVNRLDSLVFTLKPALDSANTPLTYAAGLSAVNPIPSSTGLQLNPRTGMLTFTPNVYHASSPAANAYTVVVEVAGYHKINGVRTLGSTEQINIPIYVVNQANKNPQIINATMNGQPVLPNSVFQVQVGSSLNFQFGTADANAGDSVTILNSRPPYPAYTVSGGIRPTGSFTINTLTDPGTLHFPVIVRDNACPLRGVTTLIYTVEVVANPLGLKKELASAANFTAYPNPFSEAIYFKFDLKAKAESIEIYNLLGQKVDEIALKNAGKADQEISWTNAPDFKPGTYVARLIAADKTVQTLKFTKLQ